jgi:hypothetical protein
MVGERIGNYQVMREIGSGGVGVVYEAKHEHLGRRAAVKALRPEYSQRPEMVTRFFKEARAANLIQHPAIVNVLDIGQLDNGTLYLFMEFLDGESLAARLKQAGPLPINDALRIGKQIASALAAAHARSIVHRDLKPDNVFLVPDPDMPGGERVKILDFGIVKMTGWSPERDTDGAPHHTRTGMLMGTPSYMAPEQCRGSTDVDEKADVYALGVLLYQMLTGKPPFTADVVGDLLAMHIRDQPRPLREARAEAPEPLARLVHKMLAKPRADRPGMSEVVEALERLSAARAPAPSSSSAGGKGPSPRLQAAALVVASLAALVAMGKTLLYPCPRGDGPGGQACAPPPIVAMPLPSGGMKDTGDVASGAEPAPAGYGGEVGDGGAERARTPHQERVFRRFQAALTGAVDGNAFREARRLYLELKATGSPDQPQARRLFDARFTAWASARLRLAETDRQAGRCEAARTLLSEVLGVIPDYPEALAQQALPCQQSAPPAPGRGPTTDIERLLRDARAQYNQGAYAQALTSARQILSLSGLRAQQRRDAWRVLGSAACRQRRTADADEAYDHLSGDADAQKYVLSVCKQSGLSFDGSAFR